MNRSPRGQTGRTAQPPEELVLRGRGGDREALEALIRQYQFRMANFVIAETGERAQYEDLCQTIFVKMVLALPRLREVQRFEPWLFQIARNVCRDHLRARRGFLRLFVAREARHDNMAAETAAEKDDTARLEREMARLPAEQRDLLRLSLEAPRSYEELAKLSGATLPSVKSRLWRARENLRALLAAGDPE